MDAKHTATGMDLSDFTPAIPAAMLSSLFQDAKFSDRVLTVRVVKQAPPSIPVTASDATVGTATLSDGKTLEGDRKDGKTSSHGGQGGDDDNNNNSEARPRKKRKRLDDELASLDVDEEAKDGVVSMAIDASGSEQATGESVRRILISSSFMALHSSVFKTMFTSRMKEGSDKEIEIVVHSGREANALCSMVAFMHGGQVPTDAKSADMFWLMQVADQYDVKLLIKACTDLVLSPAFQLTTEIALGVMQECTTWMNNSQHDAFKAVVKRAETHLLGIVASTFHAMTQTLDHDFYKIPLDILTSLLVNPNLEAPTENVVYTAAMFWWRNAKSKRPEDDPLQLLQCVRLENLSPLFFTVYVLATGGHPFNTHASTTTQLAIAQRLVRAATFHGVPMEFASETASKMDLTVRPSYWLHNFGVSTQAWTVCLNDLDWKSESTWRSTQSPVAFVDGFRFRACIEPSAADRYDNKQYLQPCLVYDPVWHAITPKNVMAMTYVSMTLSARNIETNQFEDISHERSIRVKFNSSPKSSSRVGLDVVKACPWQSFAYATSQYVNDANCVDLRVEFESMDRAWWSK